MDNLRIGIVGNIGVGKSTLIDHLKKPPLSEKLLALWPEKTDQTNLYTFPEEFDPDVLDAFYKDPIKHAFTAQIEFFNGRLARQSTINQARGIVLEDRTIFEDYHIFGKAQKILGRLSLPEYISYQRNFRLMTEKIAEPDLIVYLKADTPTLIERIKKRGRESEKSIPEDYLNLLNELYEEFVTRHVNCPVLVIDAQETDDLLGYLDQICQRIKERITELELRITSPKISNWVSLPQTEATIRAIKAEKRLSQHLAEQPKLITIAGNVGLGKSTLAALMHQSLGIEALYEDPLKNPLLKDFLHDKKKHCFELQKHFLKMRAQQRLQGKNSPKSHVKDRSLPEDLLIFCRQFHQDGLLTDNELDLLTTEFKTTSRTLPSADLMIVLTGRPELAWNRIQLRARKMEIEGGWSQSEITSMAKFYRTYARDVRQFGFHNQPILEVNIDRLDLTNRIHMGYLFELILESLTQYESESNVNLVCGT